MVSTSSMRTECWIILYEWMSPVNVRANAEFRRLPMRLKYRLSQRLFLPNAIHRESSVSGQRAGKKERYTMSGSKLTTMTLEEMRAACARGESKTDWARVRAAIARGEEPAEDEDAPDASAEMRASQHAQAQTRQTPCLWRTQDCHCLPMRSLCSGCLPRLRPGLANTHERGVGRLAERAYAGGTAGLKQVSARRLSLP